MHEAAAQLNGQKAKDYNMDKRLRRLMEFGLKGVEAFYSGFTDKIREELLGFAKRYGLYVTAGSDYHGTNKLIELCDTGLCEAVEWPDGGCSVNNIEYTNLPYRTCHRCGKFTARDYLQCATNFTPVLECKYCGKVVPGGASYEPPKSFWS